MSKKQESRYLPGTVLGRYVVEKFIDSGGQGEVYRARDKESQLPRTVALKIAKTIYRDSVEETPFSREAGLQFRLQHPHIAYLFDYTLLDHYPTLVMEYMPDTLRKCYVAKGRLPLSNLLDYLRQAAEALEYAHQQGIIHRDIKPENMLLKNNLLKVSDFGIAVLLSWSSQEEKLRQGTEGYRAPEGCIGPLSDQYSLAVVIYEGLLGHRPGALKGLGSIRSVLFPTSPRTALLPVVLQALARDPDRRFPNVQAFAEACEQTYKRAQDRSSRLLRRMLIAGLLVCLLVLTSIGVPLLSLVHPGQHTAPTRSVQVTTATPDLTATSTVSDQLYRSATSGTPSFSSSLAGPDSNRWQVTVSATGSCAFADGFYQVISQRVGTDMPCLEQAKPFANFAFQVDITIVNGDYGGITVQTDQHVVYFFLLGIDQSYKFDATNDPDALASGLSPVIYSAANKSNRLTLIARGSRLFLYINQQFIQEVTLASDLQGLVGLSAEADFHPTEVDFSEAQLWVLT